MSLRIRVFIGSHASSLFMVIQLTSLILSLILAFGNVWITSSTFQGLPGAFLEDKGLEEGRLRFE